MRPRIIINATMLNGRAMSGLGIYTLNVLRELLPLLLQDERVGEIRLLGDEQRLSDLLGSLCDGPGVSIGHIATTSPIKRLLMLNREIRRGAGGKPSTFYSPTHHGVICGKAAQVITIHDLFALLFPGNYRFQNYYFRFYVPRLLRRTQVVIADSDNTGRDLDRFYVLGCPVKTVYAALPQSLTLVSPRPVAALEGLRFFLSVGPAYKYKNADRLIDAFSQFRMRHEADDLRLVFVGGREPYLDFLRKHINGTATEVADEILFLGYVSEAELAWLYGRASAAMLTSLYEGFGLPALEAMHFGCPVVASNVGSLPEVCGAAALYVDPYDVSDIARALQRVTVDRELKDALSIKGRENLLRFGWEMAARKIYDILGDL